MTPPKVFSSQGSASHWWVVAASRRSDLANLSTAATVLALAIASGTTPDKGLLTAVVAGFLISALGGSRFQIGGPTGAFVVVVRARSGGRELPLQLQAVVLRPPVEGVVRQSFPSGARCPDALP